MAAPYYWSNVSVAVQSALATAVTIDSITKADPAVISTTADPALVAGDFILISAAGMAQVDGRVFRVANPAGTYTAELEGIDSTNYGTFTSGSLQEVTFGSSLSKTTGVSVSGGDANTEQWGYIQDATRRTQPTSYNQVVFTLNNIWDPADTVLADLMTAAETFEKRAFKFTWSTGPVIAFYGTVGFVGAPEGNAQGLISTTMNLTCDGRHTQYSTTV